MKRSLLKQHRKDQELSQSDFGAHFGVRKATVSKWENGKVPPNRVLAVSDLTGIPPHALRPDLYRAPDLPAREENSDV